VLVVTRLDRLARSTRDLLNVIAAITDRGAGFKSLKETVSACGVSPSFQSEPDID
jgi:DNA invertase Pin-like site-specific DNA recombinase